MGGEGYMAQTRERIAPNKTSIRAKDATPKRPRLCLSENLSEKKTPPKVHARHLAVWRKTAIRLFNQSLGKETLLSASCAQ